jgi:hypothetical protein
VLLRCPPPTAPRVPHTHTPQIRDLLLHGEPPAKGYQLQRDSHGNYVASGLTLVAVRSLEDVARCLAYGSKIRSTASTNMNAHSSRSHAVFTIHLDQEPQGTTAGAERGRVSTCGLWVVGRGWVGICKCK